MLRILFPVSIVLALSAGCYSEEATVGVGYSAGYAEPSMAYVAPGVTVVSDYDYPVFFSDGAYWRYDNGYWYSSPRLGGGWVVSYNVPVRVRSIDHPWGYAHYHPQGGVYVRDHRGYYQPSYRAAAPAYRGPAYSRPAYRAAPARGPIVRDHRR